MFVIIIIIVFFRCQNEAETRMWETTTKLTDLIETKLVEHTNPGIRINAFKCLQILIRLYSKPNDPNKKVKKKNRISKGWFKRNRKNGIKT